MNLQAMNAKLRNLVHDEDGQTTTEYILMLLVAVTVISQFKKRIGVVISALFGKIDTGIEKVGEFDNF